MSRRTQLNDSFFETHIPMSQYISYSLQLLALLFLNWVLQVLMPVIVDALMLGMREWDGVSVVFCWGIQVGFLIVSFSLRDHLRAYVNASGKKIHPFMKYSLLLGKVWVLCTGLWLLISKMNGFGFLLLGEMMLLMVQIYGWVGMAAPMGRWVLSSRSA